MMFCWSEELRTGIDEIDEHHKGIIAKLNHVQNATDRAKDRTEVLKTLRFLSQYAGSHFTVEENLMRKHSYGRNDYLKQKADHIWFLRSISALKRKLQEEAISLPMVVERLQQYWNSLLNHIKTEDKKLGTFLNSKE